MIYYRIELLPEDLPVRGNAVASGDPAYDTEVGDGILKDLDRGYVEVWCTLRVTASGFEDYTGPLGTAYLGCVSFSRGVSVKEVEEHARAHGMLGEALEDLRREVSKLQRALSLIRDDGESVTVG